jgi:hypothetical protein
MTGFISVLLGVFLYLFLVGLFEYYTSKKTAITYDVFDALIMTFYVLFGTSLSAGKYALLLLLFCLALFILGIAIKPIGDIVFEKKFYLWKKDKK